MRDDERLVAGQAKVKAAALVFRDAVNADPDFVAFKVLVGFDCVYPPAWEDDAFQYAAAEAFRTQQVTELLASVSEASADEWFDKLRRFAGIESNDAATLACLRAEFFGEVPAVELLQQRAGFHQPEDVGQRGLGVDGDELEQDLMGTAGDIDLVESVAHVVGLRSKGSHDQLGAWAQNQVLHRDGIFAARTGLGPAARLGLY